MQSEESFLERRAVRTLAARQNHQLTLGKFFKFVVQKRTLLLVEDESLAAVMDLWPSFSRFGSSTLPKFHQCLMEWRQLTPARTQQTMPAPVWEGRPSLLDHPHVAAFILILLVTFIRPSWLLALKTKDLVPPLVLLLPCRFVVIAASETGVSTKRGVRDVLVRWLQRVDSGASIDRVPLWEKSRNQHHSLPRPLRNKLETLARRVEMLLTTLRFKPCLSGASATVPQFLSLGSFKTASKHLDVQLQIFRYLGVQLC